MSLSVVILAAGKGSRMHSGKPKVLHTLAGRPILSHVLRIAELLKPEQLFCVVGHEQAQIKSSLPDAPCTWVEQSEPLGTAHAVLQALPHITTDRTLILLGDVPLMTATTLGVFLKQTPAAALGLISYHAKNPVGLGRILRDENHKVQSVVEEKDATDKQRLITEVASGIYLARTQDLKKWLPAVKNANASKEYYLPDIVPMAVQQGPVHGLVLSDPNEALGINTKAQLASAERTLQHRYAEQLLEQGVSLMDPARLDVRGNVIAGQDVTLDVNVILEGQVHLGERTEVGANVILKNVEIGANCRILPNTIIEDAVLADNVTVGPFARIRPGTKLDNGVKVGNFVEIKKSHLGENTKANHLSYIGDAEVGREVNIGAGTITCNYDGVNKSKTILEDGVFVGSNTSLVAPVKIGEQATIGAGSVITKDVSPQQLAVSRAKQTMLDGWARPEKADKKAGEA